MNILQISTLIPVILSICWTVWVKHRQRKFKEAVLLSLAGICAVLNAWLVYAMIIDNLTIPGHMLQMAACAAVIPLIYTAFAIQLNRRDKKTTIVLWVLALHSFLPNVIIQNPFLPIEYPSTPMHPFALYVLSHGEKVFAIYMGDLMVMLQVFVIFIKFIPFVRTLHRVNLHLSVKTYAFIAWCILSGIAIIVFSGMTYEDLRSPAGEAFYFLTYDFILITFNLFIMLRFDFDLVENKEGEVVSDLGGYLSKRYEDMAAELRKVVEEGRFFLNSDCTAERMVERLGTNRTFFSQMFSSQFGMSFNEYVNSLRMAYIEDLLRTTNLTITEISLKAGFNDSGYMSRKFREKHGLTPTQWRNNQNV